MNQELDLLFKKLWEQYITESPEALDIYNLFIKNGENVINDHVAFRTFDDERVNINSLGKFFEELGYKKIKNYQFHEKKLLASHYEHIKDPNLPKVFISELITKEFSSFLQSIVKNCIDSINKNLLNDNTILYRGALWQPLDYEIYKQLLKESEYAAWLYAFGYRANHFTVSVNHLNKFSSIQAVNQLLKDNNFTLNSFGGEIKGTEEELLEQSSTMANRVKIQFKQGEFEVLNSYYEFARRYKDVNGNLYTGFIASSADKIFESTNVGSN